AEFQSLNLSSPGAADYYEDLATFLNYHLGLNATAEEYEALIADCGQGALSCTESIMICPTAPSYLNPDLIVYTDCEEEALASLQEQALLQYNQLLAEAEQTFINNYLAHCGSAVQETFTVTHEIHEYHYTLYYYDQAGNLARTVPPKGVDILSKAEVSEVAAYRIGVSPTPKYPEHRMLTSYQYNSLRQLVAKKMPDVAEEHYWYDELGRLIASQDGRQVDLGNFYSYTLYDQLGRVVEVGEITPNGNDGLEQLLAVDNLRIPYADFESLITANTIPINRRYITRTYYDGAPFAVPAFGTAGQENLRNRVSTTVFAEYYPASGNWDNDYDYATHYSYDITGNVKTLVQELVELTGTGHRYKRIDYDYDFLSGNVNAVYYQKGAADQFTHRYFY
ncbi:MAG: hypothetical protein AAGA62_17335, partial [Bacteroidota bacterium]